MRVAVGRGYNLGQAKGTDNPMADLHFTYRDGPTRLCCELDDLKEDEITVVLEALKQRFDTVEQGAFRFSIKQEEDYSPLELALRQRNGEWMDSGIDEALQVMMKLNIKVDHDFNDAQPLHCFTDRDSLPGPDSQ